MYTYRDVSTINDKQSYAIDQDGSYLGTCIFMTQGDVQQIVAALNFYEQHHTEHTCVLCGYKGPDVKGDKPENLICLDADACVRRINQYHTCHRCGHTGPEVCLPMPGVSTEQWFCLGGCLPDDNRLGKDIDPHNYG